MMLETLMRKGGLVHLASAIPAIPAIAQRGEAVQASLRVATIAEIAVAAPELQTPDERPPAEDAVTELAAIIEHCGGIQDLWADGYARLCTMPCPEGYRNRSADWQTLVNNTGLFLDQWGMKAAALGWQAHDLFAVHRTAPLRRYDGRGLLPALETHRVVEMTSETALLQTASGAELVFTRTPYDPLLGTCMIWEL